MAEPISHDQNFKNLIVDYPHHAFEFFAPEEAPRPGDAVRIVPVREELLKAHLGERFRRLDVPLLAEWTDGRREAVLFAVEEETDPGRFSPLRLAQYCVGLAGMFDTRRVVPVVVFLRRGAVSDTLRLGTERHDYLTFDYITCALGDMAAGDWLDSDNLVARVNLPNMRVQSDGRVDVYANAVRGLLELEPDLNRREKYIEFIDIYTDLSDNERRIYRERHPKESGIMTGMFQRAREEGRTEGMQLGHIAGQQQGQMQGRMEGERKFLERQLRRKFGTLSSVVGARLSKASVTDLEAWGDNVLDADTIDEVFNPH